MLDRARRAVASVPGWVRPVTAATPDWVKVAGGHAASALPLSLVLGVGLGLTVALGANLSNAFPSESRPFGWKGPASFENGVAMVRPALATVGSLPPLILGWLVASRWSPQDRMPGWLMRVGAAALLCCAAVAFGAWWGIAASKGAADGSYAGFVRAHMLLALTFLSVGALVGTWAPRTGVAWGAGFWAATMLLLEDFLKFRVFREAGYTALASGEFPGWFYAAQALSPLAAYRGVLILDNAKFRDWTEHAVLDDATLPSWLTSANMAWLMLGLWVLLPLFFAVCSAWVRVGFAGRVADQARRTPIVARPASAATGRVQASPTGGAGADSGRQLPGAGRSDARRVAAARRAGPPRAAGVGQGAAVSPRPAPDEE